MESTNNPPTTGTSASGQWEFPLELEREIFETTALLYPKTIPKLLRVARRVLLIEPLLYNAIVIDVFHSIRRPGAEMLLARIATKGAEFFSNAVRHMFIGSLDFGIPNDKLWLAKDLETVFRVCTGVDHLLLIGDFAKPPLLQMLVATDMRPTSLFLGLLIDPMTPQLDFAHPFFARVSHLSLARLDAREDLVQENLHYWPTIFRLPALTHLVLWRNASPSLVQAIFTGSPHLKVFIIPCTDPRIATLFSEELVLHDVRLVLSGLDSTHSLDELWTRAEEFVSHKRSGQIRASDYYLPPSQSPAQANVHVESGSGSSAVQEAHG
ncbi:hypothetical protein C8R44DRAFT_744593 [Mycena epipterygia]|nr:hypothetical protein C8R44DRAFT_744593 [Mycena epipterygia]